MEKANELAEQQKEIKEKGDKIQQLKEKLMLQTNKTEIKKKYNKKEAQAREGTRRRIYENAEREIENEIQLTIAKKNTEKQVEIYSI